MLDENLQKFFDSEITVYTEHWNPPYSLNHFFYRNNAFKLFLKPNIWIATLLQSTAEIIRHVPPPEPGPHISLRATGYFWSASVQLREGWSGEKIPPLYLPIYKKYHKQKALNGSIISYSISRSKTKQSAKVAKLPAPFQNHFFLHFQHFGFSTLEAQHLLLAGKRHRSIPSRNTYPPTRTDTEWYTPFLCRYRGNSHSTWARQDKAINQH